MYGTSKNQLVNANQETAQWVVGGRGSCSIWKTIVLSLAFFNAKVDARPLVMYPNNPIPVAQMAPPVLPLPITIVTENHYRTINAPEGRIVEESRLVSRFIGNDLDIQEHFEKETFSPKVSVQEDQYGNTIMTNGEKVVVIALDNVF